MTAYEMRISDCSSDVCSSDLSSERRAAVAEVVGRYGLLLDQTAPITRGSVAAGSIRVIVTRSEARVDNCPDWDRISQPELDAFTMSNFGCATPYNMAEMIPCPNDLVVGRAFARVQTNEAIKALDDI